MRRWLVGFAALALVGPALVAPAHARPQGDTYDALMTSTLTLTDERGGVYTLLLSPDGKMEQVNSVGVWALGVWNRDKDRGLCWTARGASTLCVPLPLDKDVGDTWEMYGPTGRKTFTAAIVEGRADLHALSKAR